MPDLNASSDRIIAPVPRITIQAFCETSETAALIESVGSDRRMQKAHVKVQMGGGPASVEAYRHAPTPNVIVIETQGARSRPLECLDALAEVCDEGTKVVVIGHVNDVQLYRQFIQRGVSEYLMAPVQTIDLIQAISDLFTVPGAKPVGRTVAVVGAKGGVGTSTIAHNLAWTVAREQDTATVIADLDIAFGTASLNFNQDPPQGIAEAVFAPDRLDSNLLDLLRAAVPCIVLDVPHQWTAWSRRMLIGADEILIVASPELASLRNTKNLLTLLQQNRPNDRKPRVILNGTGVPKRPEIAPAEFAKSLDTTLAASVPFDAALFGTAANNGQMIAEVQSGAKAVEVFSSLAASVIGRAEQRRPRQNLFEPLLSKLARRKAS